MESDSTHRVNFSTIARGTSFYSRRKQEKDDSLLICLGYDDIVETGQFTKYCAQTPYFNTKIDIYLHLLH